MSGIIPITQHLDELEAAVAAEREACAKLVESLCANEVVGEENCWRFQHRALEQSAKAIRARRSVTGSPPPVDKSTPTHAEVAGRDSDATEGQPDALRKLDARTAHIFEKWGPMRAALEKAGVK
jgi:hypothetical protein